MAAPCGTCNGTGRVTPPGSKCKSCNGRGKVRERKTVDIDIPAGIEDGMRVRIARMGDMPLDGEGQPGDLLVQVDVLSVDLGIETSYFSKRRSKCYDGSSGSIKYRYSGWYGPYSHN
jgi:DnaJ-class molecular chaperone